MIRARPRGNAINSICLSAIALVPVSRYSLVMPRKSLNPDFVDAHVNVRYAETDQMGVAYYANYLVWFEVGRVAWCRAKGFRYRDMEVEDRRFFTVAEAACRYRAPARFEDDILVRTAVAVASDKVVRFRYEIRRRETGELLATGHTAHVVTDSNLRPARLPERFRECFGLEPPRAG